MSEPASPAPDYALLDQAGAGGIFFPRADRTATPPGAVDHRLQVAPGVEIAARFYAHDPALPTLLYFHGNGEVASDHDDIAPLYHQTGANLFVAEFRGYGGSDGRPSLAGLVADANPIAAQFHALLDEAGFNASRLIMGRSLGSHPALEIAANASDRFSALVIESGAAILRRLLSCLGLPEIGPAADLVAAHEAKIRSIRLPSLIIHGERDDLVPLEHAAELDNLLGDTDRTLLVIPDAGHNDLLWRGLRQYCDAIGDLLRRTT